PGLHVVPTAQGKNRSERGHAIWWRATDACNRPRLDGPPTLAHARRAISRIGAVPGPADLPHHPRYQLAGHDDTARRAKRVPGAARRLAWLCFGDWPRRVTGFG